MTTTDIAPQAEPDWGDIAKQALANGADLYSKKLTRGRLRDLCKDLASGIPLETACRLRGVRPNNVRAWEQDRPRAWHAIETARAIGEARELNKIDQATDWKAAAYRLGLIRPEYRENNGATNSGGSGITVIVNVPVPQLVEPGARPAIDITPQAVDSAPSDNLPTTAK